MPFWNRPVARPDTTIDTIATAKKPSAVMDSTLIRAVMSTNTIVVTTSARRIRTPIRSRSARRSSTNRPAMLATLYAIEK